MDTKRDTRDAHAMGKATRGHSEKMAICKSRRAASGGPTGDAKVGSLSPKRWGASGGFEMGSERGRVSLRALSGSRVEIG